MYFNWKNILSVGFILLVILSSVIYFLEYSNKEVPSGIDNTELIEKAHRIIKDE